MRSYKICIPSEFDKSKFTGKPLVRNNQPLFEGMPLPASTKIQKSPDQITLGDFESYIIEHEYEEKTDGRLDERFFSAFIKRAKIPAYYSSKKQIVLLAGKKRDILDFCYEAEKLTGIAIDTLQIDMSKLESVLTNINLVWASNHKSQGAIRASALMGSHIEQTQEYEKLKKTSALTTFAFSFEKDGRLHPIMVTHDGTVVLQSSYPTISEEVELVLSIYDELVSQFAMKKSKSTKSKSTAVLLESS